MLKTLKSLFGSTPIIEFGPIKLKVVREQLMSEGLSRSVVNRYVHRLRNVFRWGVENELVPTAVHQAQCAVGPLLKGKTEAARFSRDRPKTLQLSSWVAGVVDKANELLGDRHGSIGPSHFMRSDLDAAWLELIWKHSVLPYLAEQFFGEEDRLQAFELATLRDLSSNGDDDG